MEDNIGTLCADVSRLLRRSFDERARGIGVTRPQWQVLSVLFRHEGVNQGGLAELLDVEPITVCRMVDRLQDAELVVRRPDPSDRRAWCLFLTPKAHQVLDQLRPLAQSMFEVALEGIEDSDRAIALSALDRIRSNLSRRPLDSLVSNG